VLCVVVLLVSVVVVHTASVMTGAAVSVGCDGSFSVDYRGAVILLGVAELLVFGAVSIGYSVAVSVGCGGVLIVGWCGAVSVVLLLMSGVVVHTVCVRRGAAVSV
jgi:hypothetical protein